MGWRSSAPRFHPRPARGRLARVSCRPILWTPSPGDVARAHVTRFVADHVRARGGAAAAVADSASLHAWSVAHPAEFWEAVWRFTGVVADVHADGSQWDETLVGGDRMAPPDPVHGPRWFTGARLNFAENLLRSAHPAVGGIGDGERGHTRSPGGGAATDREALVLWTEEGPGRRLTYGQLARDVAAFAAFLRLEGVTAGDRVAGFVPNVPEAVVAMLAATSLGAVWSSCSPDFGVDGVIDRFGQIAPTVLVCADGYRYAGREIDSLARVAEIVARLPSVRRTVVIPHRAAALPARGAVPAAVGWEEALGRGTGAGPDFRRLPFDHPTYILYSSGTTGLPKCLVHGAGGTLLQHLKELVLHTDLGADDTIFYFTTCGWMMWNWLVSSLAVGARVVLYDGAPLLRGGAILWDMAAEERVSVFGTSARWIALTEKEGTVPRDTHDLSALRTILSTGSPLADSGFDYVYEKVRAEVRLSSISGGTDIISCFALGDPTRPVRRGELQTLGHGMRVEVWSAQGESVVGVPGELVCTAPFPSMPVAFWNDPTGEKYRAAYFAHFPGVWRHGDWAERTACGGLVIHGRSDATLNPGGVRIGTAEIYRQVERFSEVEESVVVGQTLSRSAGPEERVVLFVKLRPGAVLDEALRERIRRRIREHATPHHVPRRIVEVPDIPRTRSGKITELAVRDVVHGRPVAHVEALANPEALAHFRDRPELRE